MHTLLEFWPVAVSFIAFFAWLSEGNVPLPADEPAGE
jgi:hypothetical protein